MIAADYAKALYRARTSDVRLLQNLHVVLARRGHTKLLPRIYAEYQKLQLRQDRAAIHMQTIPERERVRNLLHLYRALTK